MTSSLSLTSHGRRRTPEWHGLAQRAGADALLGALGVVAVLVAWELASVTGLLPATTIPSMTTVGAQLLGLLAEPAFWSQLQATLASWAIAMLLTCVIAVPAGLLIGSSRFAEDSTRALIEFLKPIPPIALIPLGLLLWGPSLTMKLTLVVFGALWPLLTQVVYGVRDVDQVALAMARSYRLGRTQTIARVVVPGISPYVVTGLRVSAAIALIVTIVTEMIGGVPGIGRGIVQAQTANALPSMYALIIVTGLLGLAVNGLFRLTERRMLHWHPSQRREVRS